MSAKSLQPRPVVYAATAMGVLNTTHFDGRGVGRATDQVEQINQAILLQVAFTQVVGGWTSSPRKEMNRA